MNKTHHRIPIVVGQIWESSDARHHGRRCRIVAVGGDPLVAVLEDQKTGRRTTIQARRLCGRYHWRFVPPETTTVPAS